MQFHNNASQVYTSKYGSLLCSNSLKTTNENHIHLVVIYPYKLIKAGSNKVCFLNK